MIGGNSLGGMLSRLAVGVLADYDIWREAVAGLGVMTLLGAVLVWRLLPPSRHFEPRRLSLGNAISGYALHLGNPLLRRLFLTGFLIMGSFVAFFNYISFHLMREPIALSQSAVGWLSLVYLLSTVTSARVGALADRLGARKVLIGALGVAVFGVGLTIIDQVVPAILGVAIFICGFFAAHAVVSGWVGRSARQARAQATSLYQIFFYLGANVAGSLGGQLWQRADWAGVSLMLTAMLLLSAVLAFRSR